MLILQWLSMAARAREQPTLFAPALPDGMVFVEEFVSASQERALLDRIATLDLTPFEFRGFTAKRRIAVFGLDYDFSGRALNAAPAIPGWLQPLRTRAAALAGVGPDALTEALVTEYTPGTSIGWHRDAPPFGIIVGVSLAASCRFRLKHRRDDRRVTIDLPPRSAYVLSGEARDEWDHSIPPVTTLRYSVTFRTRR